MSAGGDTLTTQLQKGFSIRIVAPNDEATIGCDTIGKLVKMSDGPVRGWENADTESLLMELNIKKEALAECREEREASRKSEGKLVRECERMGRELFECREELAKANETIREYPGELARVSRELKDAEEKAGAYRSKYVSAEYDLAETRQQLRIAMRALDALTRKGEGEA